MSTNSVNAQAPADAVAVNSAPPISDTNSASTEVFEKTVTISANVNRVVVPFDPKLERQRTENLLSNRTEEGTISVNTSKSI